MTHQQWRKQILLTSTERFFFDRHGAVVGAILWKKRTDIWHIPSCKVYVYIVSIRQFTDALFIYDTLNLEIPLSFQPRSRFLMLARPCAVGYPDTSSTNCVLVSSQFLSTKTCAPIPFLLKHTLPFSALLYLIFKIASIPNCVINCLLFSDCLLFTIPSHSENTLTSQANLIDSREEYSTNTKSHTQEMLFFLGVVGVIFF